MDLDIPYRGGFVGREHHFALSVYFEDTDTAGFVYYANYLKYMERARSDMLRAAGIDQRAAQEAGTGVYAVAEVAIRYVRPARLGDDLVVLSTIEQVRAASVVIHQRVMRRAELLTDARLTAAFLDASDRPTRQPRDWVEKFKAIARETMPEIQASTDLMSPLTLFLHADAVVKLVMLGLLLASIWTWAIILTHATRLRRINRATEKYEADFWAAEDIEAFHSKRGAETLPTAVVLSAGLDEWRRSTRVGKIDRSGTRERLATRMNAAVAAELDRLSDRLNILATVGSVAPFVGLFGTVWGIMRAFTAIADANNTSLAVVAPGIAEALFATAIGLFAAIPAVIAYNRLTHGLDRLEARLGRFADRFHATLSRELEVEV